MLKKLQMRDTLCNTDTFRSNIEAEIVCRISANVVFGYKEHIF